MVTAAVTTSAKRQKQTEECEGADQRGVVCPHDGTWLCRYEMGTLTRCSG